MGLHLYDDVTHPRRPPPLQRAPRPGLDHDRRRPARRAPSLEPLGKQPMDERDREGAPPGALDQRAGAVPDEAQREERPPLAPAPRDALERYDARPRVPEAALREGAAPNRLYANRADAVRAVPLQKMPSPGRRLRRDRRGPQPDEAPPPQSASPPVLEARGGLKERREAPPRGAGPAPPDEPPRRHGPPHDRLQRKRTASHGGVGRAGRATAKFRLDANGGQRASPIRS